MMVYLLYLRDQRRVLRDLVGSRDTGAAGWIVVYRPGNFILGGGGFRETLKHGGGVYRVYEGVKGQVCVSYLWAAW